MDAMEFCKQLDRICKNHFSCESCPLGGGKCSIRYIGRNRESIVKEVEQWAKDHPVKIRQSEFLKLFPNAQKSDGIINICPILIDEGCKSTSECLGTRCNVCRQLFWNEEVTDNGN
jgi:hypothetical protein